MKRCAPTRMPKMLATLALGALSACANTPPLEAFVTQESTAARAERVFRYQSRIADSLLDRYPMREDFARADWRLQNAEATMTESCGALTRAVLSDVAGEELSWSDKLAVMESLTPCEHAARALDDLILQLDQPQLASGGI